MNYLTSFIHFLKGHDIPEQTKSEKCTVLGFGD